MIIPGVYDTFWNTVRLEDGNQTCFERTPDVFLLWGSLVWTGSFLYVDRQFLLGLVFINWAGGIMYLFAAINVETRASPVRPAAAMLTSLQCICF